MLSWSCLLLCDGEIGCGCSRGRLKQQLAQGCSGAEETGANCINRRAQHGGNLEVAELFEFAEKQNFAVNSFELAERFADQGVGFDGGFDGVVDNWLRSREGCTEECLASMCAENPVSDRIEVGSEERSGLVAIDSAQYGDEGLLRQFFGE